MRLKRLKFAERQAQLQLLVEREQGELMQMNDRAYRSVARQCVRQRLDKMRAVSDLLECEIPVQLPSGPGCVSASCATFNAFISCFLPRPKKGAFRNGEAPSP